MCLST